MVTALIIAGVIVAGTATAGICYTVKESKEKKANLEKEISSYSNTVNSLTSLRTELTNTKNNLDYAKIAFTNGGHNYNGNPPAKSNFDECSTEINNALTYIQKIIDESNECIKSLTAEKNKL